MALVLLALRLRFEERDDGQRDGQHHQRRRRVRHPHAEKAEAIMKPPTMREGSVPRASMEAERGSRGTCCASARPRARPPRTRCSASPPLSATGWRASCARRCAGCTPGSGSARSACARARRRGCTRGSPPPFGCGQRERQREDYAARLGRDLAAAEADLVSFNPLHAARPLSARARRRSSPRSSRSSGRRRRRPSSGPGPFRRPCGGAAGRTSPAGPSRSSP